MYLVRHGVLYFETKLHVGGIKTWEEGVETAVTANHPLLEQMLYRVGWDCGVVVLFISRSPGHGM